MCSRLQRPAAGSVEGFDCVTSPWGKGYVRVLRTGMGEQRSAAAAYAALGLGAKQLLITGLCGGLSPKLSTGGLVVSSAAAAEGEAAALEADKALQLAAMQAAQLAGLKALRGTIITTQETVCTPVEKRRLAVQTAAPIAVDMETRATAQIAAEFGVPWVAVRAVSDTSAETLPLRFDDFVSPVTGEVDTRKLALYTAARPWKAAALAKLGKSAATACRSLSLFTDACLAATAPNSMDALEELI